MAPAGTNVIERVTRVQFTDEGITGQITVRHQGIANAYYKNLLDDDTDDEHREYLEDYLKEHIADARLESFTIHHLRDRQAPLEIVIDFSLATFGTLSVQSSFTQGLLTLTRRYVLNPETFGVTHYEAARAFLKRLTVVDNTPLLFVTE